MQSLAVITFFILIYPHDLMFKIVHWIQTMKETMKSKSFAFMASTILGKMVISIKKFDVWFIQKRYMMPVERVAARLRW